MIAQIASALEILIAFLVLVAIDAAGIRLVQDVFFFAVDTTGTQTFQQVLGQLYIAIGNSLKLSLSFPPLHTVRATFTAHGVPPFMIRY